MEITTYYIAQTLEDAYQKLNANNQNAILGGGAWLKHATKHVDTMIDLSNLHLDEIEDRPDVIEIGSCVTLRSLETNPLVQTIGQGFLSEASSQIMGTGFRNIATLGGSIVGKFPFSDLLTPLLTLNVTLRFYPKKEITLQDFLDQKGKVTEILTHIIIKKTKSVGFFKKIANTVLDFSILNVAILRDKDIKIALGARPGKALLALDAMKMINQAEKIDDHVIEQAAKKVVETIRFSSDHRGSEDYRKALAVTYVSRGIKEVTRYEG
ncbi:MAG: FAD binding domain-containing protein [Acholeplasmataceae bacterium]|nr:FAD binding domain-containing protein [Acholeplasmataceae bacterium]